jgi:PhnB protein
MKLNPYFFFNGQCEAAFKFYERILGGKIEALMPHAGTPAANHVPKEWQSKIMHACMTVNGELLMASDVPPGDYEQPKGFSVTLNITDAAEAERVFHALAENGQVQMPIQETFWAVRFGMLVDRFGTPWMVNCAKPLGSTEYDTNICKEELHAVSH